MYIFNDNLVSIYWVYGGAILFTFSACILLRFLIKHKMNKFIFMSVVIVLFLLSLIVLHRNLYVSEAELNDIVLELELEAQELFDEEKYLLAKDKLHKIYALNQNLNDIERTIANLVSLGIVEFELDNRKGAFKYFSQGLSLIFQHKREGTFPPKKEGIIQYQKEDKRLDLLTADILIAIEDILVDQEMINEFQVLYQEYSEIRLFLKDVEANAYTVLGDKWRLNHDFNLARNSYLKSLQLTEEIVHDIENGKGHENFPDTNKLMFPRYFSLATLEIEAGNFNVAFNYFSLLKDLLDPKNGYQQQDLFELLIKLNSLEHSVFEVLMDHKSLKEFDKLYSSIANIWGLNQYYLQMGDVEFENGYYEEAKIAYLKSYNIWKGYFDSVVNDFHEANTKDGKEFFIPAIKRNGYRMIKALNKVRDLENHIGDTSQASKYSEEINIANKFIRDLE